MTTTTNTLLKTNNQLVGMRPGRSSEALLVTGVENVLYNTTSHLLSPDGGQHVDTAGDQLWEEDALWRDRLRRVSHQHARSMDDLDRISSPVTSHSRMPSTTNDEEDSGTLVRGGKSPGRISRGVKYVNEDTKSNSLRRKVYRKRASDKSRSPSLRNSQADSDEEEGGCAAKGAVVPAPVEDDDNDVYVQLAVNAPKNGSAGDLYETLMMEDLRTKKTQDMDREKIRQWDFMSSGLMTSKNGGRRSLDSHQAFVGQQQQRQRVAEKSSGMTLEESVLGVGGSGSGGGGGTTTTTRTRTTSRGYSASPGGGATSSGCGPRQSK